MSDDRDETPEQWALRHFGYYQPLLPKPHRYEVAAISEEWYPTCPCCGSPDGDMWRCGPDYTQYHCMRCPTDYYVTVIPGGDTLVTVSLTEVNEHVAERRRRYGARWW